MLNWNVAGIANAWKAKKYIEGFDVIMMQETWLEKGKEKGWTGKLSRKYTWVTKAAERFKKKGRAKGGILVGISKEVSFEGAEEWKYGIKIKSLEIGGGDIVNIIVVYSNEKVKKMIEEVKKEIEGWIGKGETILLIGDFNARIGKWQISREGEREESRKSEDEKSNREGMQLLDLCEEIGGSIRNGSTRGDWEGKITFVGGGVGDGGSVLDLVIEIENDKGSLISKMEVITRIESDHLPIEIGIRVEKEVDGKKERNGKKTDRQKEYRLRWEKDKAQEYGVRMERKGGEMIKEGEVLGLQDRWGRIVGAIWEIGNELKMIKEVKKGEGGGGERPGY